jgi:hypothetical protein
MHLKCLISIALGIVVLNGGAVRGYADNFAASQPSQVKQVFLKLQSYELPASTWDKIANGSKPIITGAVIASLCKHNQYCTGQISVNTPDRTKVLKSVPNYVDFDSNGAHVVDLTKYSRSNSVCKAYPHGTFLSLGKSYSFIPTICGGSFVSVDVSVSDTTMTPDQNLSVESVPNITSQGIEATAVLQNGIPALVDQRQSGDEVYVDVLTVSYK